jgi:SAM-dependent methyltransferase
MDEHDHGGHAGHDHGQHRHGSGFDSPDMIDYAELDGEVFLDATVRGVARLAERCASRGVAVERVLDVGCGPGVGTCCLAERFEGATVVAADGSAAMLARAAARARRRGVAARVETRQLELPAGLDALGRADAIWASMVLHHVGDERDGLRRIRALLEPGGLLALVERAGLARVLPDGADLGRPGLWERLDGAWAAWFARMRSGLPGATVSTDYPSMLEDAGFDVETEELLTVSVDPPLGTDARRFAHKALTSAKAQLEAFADPADLAALDPLIDEHGDASILRRSDARIRASRHLYVARARSRATRR